MITIIDFIDSTIKYGKSNVKEDLEELGLLNSSFDSML